MEPLKRIEEGHSNSNDDSDNNMVATETADEGSNTMSLLVVILSLFFVAIFGYALIGGVISGDPTKGFSTTLIVASAVAAAVAILVFARYLYVKQGLSNNNDLKNKGTFSTNDEENQEEPLEIEDPEFPIEIKAIPAKSVVGEMSALSPGSYGDNSLTTFHQQIIRQQQLNERRGFDFSRITHNEEGENTRRREDPPEVRGESYETPIVISDSSDPPEETTESKNEAEKSGLVRPKSPALSVAKSLPPSILKKNLKVGQIRCRIELKRTAYSSIMI